MLSEAKHLPKAKHLALAGVEILRLPFIAFRALAQGEVAHKQQLERRTKERCIVLHEGNF
jgi:hypothetical protein